MNKNMVFFITRVGITIVFVTVIWVLLVHGFDRAFATVYFQSTFETGDVSEWIGDGGGNHTGGGRVVAGIARSGNHSWKAYNDPNLPYPYNESAKLLRWRFDYLQAYYSAWFFWPTDYRVNGIGGQYVNIFQWKERSFPYDPTWIVAVKNSYSHPGMDEIVLHDYHGVHLFRNNVILPKGRWFMLEAFMKLGRADGKLIVWLDGRKIFDLTNINTSGNPSNVTGFLMWGVGNYGNSGIGKYIFVDDAIVSDTRAALFPGTGLRTVDR